MTRAGRTVAALGGSAFVSSATIRIADPLLPQIAADYGVTPADASVAVTAFALAYGVLQVFYGPAGDRLGKLRLVAWAMVGAAGATVACAFAPSLAALALLRFVSGAFAAAVIPLSIAWIGDAVPYEHRQTTLARFMSGTMLGLVMGQSASGILSQLLGWRSNFLILGALFLLAATVLLAESRREGKAVARAAGLHGMLRQYAAVLGRPWPRTVLLAVTIEGFLFYGALTYLAAWLHHRFDLGWTVIGMTVACFGIGGLVFAATVRRFVRALGETGMPLLGGSLMALGFLAIPFAPGWPLVPPLVVVLGLGFYMFHNTLQTQSTQMVPEARGTAVSVFATCLFLGQGIGAAALGRVVDAFGYPAMFGASGVLLLGLGLWFRRARMAA